VDTNLLVSREGLQSADVRLATCAKTRLESDGRRTSAVLAKSAADTAWTPERIEQIVQWFVDTKNAAMACRDLGPAVAWKKRYFPLYTCLQYLYATDKDVVCHAAWTALSPHFHQIWPSVWHLTSKVAAIVDNQGGHGRAIMEAGNALSAAIIRLPQMPDVPSVNVAWVAAFAELQYLEQRASIAVATSPPEGKPAAVDAPGDNTPEAAAPPPWRKKNNHRRRRRKRARIAAAPAPGSVAPDAPAELPDLVTLTQAAALVNRTADALRHYRGKGMPKPFVLGVKGKPNEYRWSEMRPWLEKTFARRIPEVEIRKFRTSG
jgi:hypothetical protein